MMELGSSSHILIWREATEEAEENFVVAGIAHSSPGLPTANGLAARQSPERGGRNVDLFVPDRREISSSAVSDAGNAHWPVVPLRVPRRAAGPAPLPLNTGPASSHTLQGVPVCRSREKAQETDKTGRKTGTMTV